MKQTRANKKLYFNCVSVYFYQPRSGMVRWYFQGMEERDQNFLALTAKAVNDRPMQLLQLQVTTLLCCAFFRQIGIFQSSFGTIPVKRCETFHLLSIVASFPILNLRQDPFRKLELLRGCLGEEGTEQKYKGLG